MRSSLRTTLLLVGGILLTLGVLIASETGNSRLTEGYRQVIQSQQAQTAINALLAELVNAEAGQRGYLLTGNEEYLEPYNLAIPKIRTLVADVGNHYRTSPAELTQFNAIAGLIDRKLTEMELTLIYGKRDLQVALDLVRTDFGKQSLDGIRRGLAELYGHEAVKVSRSLAFADRDLMLARWGIALITALNIVLLVVLGMQYARRLAQAEEEHERLSQESQFLDRLVRQRTSQLSDLAAHLQRVTEEEKTRLSRELHDELGALLTATKLDLHWVRGKIAKLDPAPAEVLDKLKRVVSHVDQGIQIKRRLIEDLRPTVLLNFGICEAVQQLVEEVGARNGWETAVKLPEDMPPLTTDAAIALYRIVQESMTNASKYAGATRVEIELRCTDEVIRLTVRDNGKGFMPDREADRQAGHHGLLGMEQRAIALGGWLQADSRPAQGVVVVVELPRASCVQPVVPDGAEAGLPVGDNSSRDNPA
ncbi:sensor histidine kinase [Imbroritus primus]|uniref:sensor histidine kinase n=1 Tax=Imbroritus primus TaxID=3058603 RepID=UPI003D160F2E